MRRRLRLSFERARRSALQRTRGIRPGDGGSRGRRTAATADARPRARHAGDAGATAALRHPAPLGYRMGLGAVQPHRRGAPRRDQMACPGRRRGSGRPGTGPLRLCRPRPTARTVRSQGRLWLRLRRPGRRRGALGRGGREAVRARSADLPRGRSQGRGRSRARSPRRVGDEPRRGPAGLGWNDRPRSQDRRRRMLRGSPDDPRPP